MINQPSPFGNSPFTAPFQNTGSLGKKPVAMSPGPTRSPAGAGPPAGTPRMVQYIADYSGCGFWRLLWPESILNAHQKAISSRTSLIIKE